MTPLSTSRSEQSLMASKMKRSILPWFRRQLPKGETFRS
jgi:hypothetical protein